MMTYYKFKIDNIYYVLDINDEIESLRENIDIDNILREFDIESFETNQTINFTDEIINILVKDKYIRIESLTSTLLEYIKAYFFNFTLTEFLKKRDNPQYSILEYDYSNNYNYFISKYDQYKIDKETVFLEILNNGDVSEIELLEIIINDNELFNEKMVRLDFNGNSERLLINTDNLAEFILMILKYAGRFIFDYKSFETSKNILFQGEED